MPANRTLRGSITAKANYRESYTSVTVDVDAVQDLNGYDYPWVGGAGKNLLPMLIDDIKANATSGTWTDNTYVYRDGTFAFSVNDGGAITSIDVSGTASGGIDIPIINLTGSLPSWLVADSTYTVSGSATNAYLQVIPRAGSSYKGEKTDTSFTWDSTWDGVYIRIRVNSGASLSGTLYPMIELGSEATTFEPYENICPITGWTGAEVWTAGINQCDEVFEDGYISSSGNDSSYTNAIRSANYCPCLPSTSYYFYVPSGMTGCAVAWYDSNQTFIQRDGDQQNAVITSPSTAYYFRLSLYNYKASYSEYSDNISINYPSSDTSYHAYTGDTYSYDWSGDGTVYGGTLDALTGEVTVTHGYVDLGDLAWGMNNHATLGTYFYGVVSSLDIEYEGAYTTTTYSAISSNYSCVKRDASVFVDGTFCFDGSTGSVTQIQIKDANYSDATTFKSAMSGVQFCYKLATPTTISTSAQSITPQEYIWADTGDVTVEYGLSDLGLSAEITLVDPFS